MLGRQKEPLFWWSSMKPPPVSDGTRFMVKITGSDWSCVLNGERARGGDSGPRKRTAPLRLLLSPPPEICCSRESSRQRQDPTCF